MALDDRSNICHQVSVVNSPRRCFPLTAVAAGERRRVLDGSLTRRRYTPESEFLLLLIYEKKKLYKGSLAAAAAAAAATAESVAGRADGCAVYVNLYVCMLDDVIFGVQKSL